MIPSAFAVTYHLHSTVTFLPIWGFHKISVVASLLVKTGSNGLMVF